MDVLGRVTHIIIINYRKEIYVEDMLAVSLSSPAKKFLFVEGCSQVCIFSGLLALSLGFGRYWVVKMESCKTGSLMTALVTGGDQTLNLLRSAFSYICYAFREVGK